MTNDFETYLSTFSPDVQALVQQARELVQSTLPDLEERAHLGWGALMYGKPGAKMVDCVCHISPHKRDVNLGFYKGTQLPDPEGLLVGTGKNLRHVKLKQSADVARPALKTLLEAAYAQP